MKIDSANYRPAIDGKSDKFSWNLYRVFKRYDRLLVDFKVLQIGWSCIQGICDPRDGDAYLVIYTGDQIPLVGHLPQIMTRADKAIFSPGIFSGVGWGEIEKIDITEQWFNEYGEKGRCIVVGYWSHKWDYQDEESRTCLYCGEQEIRHIEMVPKESWTKAA
jgi:hypothetical protein